MDTKKVKNHIRFSIIIPIYNVEDYLVQCVQSITNQCYENYEVILVDDGSPDNCPEICDKLALDNDKIKVLHKTNGGLSDARNAGLAISKGDYITFVDSDDFWKGNLILSQINDLIIKHDYPDIIVSDFIRFFDDRIKYLYPGYKHVFDYTNASKQEILEYFYFCHADMKISACQKFAKRELLTCYPFEKGLLSEDIDWTLQLYPEAKSIVGFPTPFYCYRQQRPGSITTTASKRSIDSILYIIDKWSQRIPSLSIPQEEKLIYMGYLAYQLSICMYLVNRLSYSQHEAVLKRISQFLYLFDYPRNFKTKKVAFLLRVCGLRITCRLLAIYKGLNRHLRLF